MIEEMPQVHMSEAEVARNFAAVLAQVRQGVEVIVEQGAQAVAVIRMPVSKGRRMSEVIAALEASGANAVVDEDFARDVQAAVDAQREPWNPPSWD